MTIARRPPLHCSLPLVGVLSACLGGLSAAETPRIEAPDLTFDVADGCLVARRGFVASLGDRLLLGDALRYDQRGDSLYARGRVVYVMPGVRLHADRLGLRPQAESGEAWEVEAIVERDGRRLVITAGHVRFDRRQLEFSDVHVDGGHGGIIGLGAGTVRIVLREHPVPDRDGIARQAEGIALVSPVVSVVGLPVFWLPYLYRDFILDYPWTRFRAGHDRRLGDYLRVWVGSSLTELWDWHTRLELRGDAYSQSGEGGGATAFWRRDDLGYGQAEFFGLQQEVVRGGPTDTDELETRHARLVDLEQQLHGNGPGESALALSARWLSVPDADPLVPGGSGAGLPPDERFRTDFLRDDLEHRPLARRGVTGAWTCPFGSLVLDTERRDHLALQTTDRLWGAQLAVPETQLMGQVYVGGQAWTESLEREFADTAAIRTNYDAHLGVMDWFGGLGLDADAGVRGLQYDQGRIAGLDFTEAQGRYLAYGDAGVRLRLVGTLGEGLTHTISPRLGVQLLGSGRGDPLPAYGFGDPRDLLEEDRRLLTTGFDTSLAGTRELFRASAVARWALREHDRIYLDTLGAQEVSPHALVDVTGSVAGSPIASVTMTGTGIYDAQLNAWRSLDAATTWVASRRCFLRYTSTLLPADTVHPRAWQHRPGISFLANRYRLDLDTTFQPGGDALDGWGAQLTRRMVDGEWSLFYELVRDGLGDVYDRRLGFSLSLSVGSTGAPSPTPSRRGTAFNF